MSVSAAHTVRLAACQHTLDWVRRDAETWTRGVSLDDGDYILLTLFARSTRTYAAIVRHLGDVGYGEQGMMLCRSLFEDMLDMRWVVTDKPLAVTRLAQHDLYSRLLRAEVQKRFPDEFKAWKPRKLRVTNEERKDLRRLFGPSGGKSWTGLYHDEKLDAVLPSWSTESDRQTVRFYDEWVLKLMNETLHPSGFSIARAGSPTLDDDGRPTWRLSSTPDMLLMAVSAANWTYVQAIQLLIELYAPTRANDLEAARERVRRDFRTAQNLETDGLVP